MKIKNLYVPLSLVATFAGLFAFAVSCAKKSSDAERAGRPLVNSSTNAVPAVANEASTNVAAVTNPIAPAETLAAPSAPTPEITNAPPAETTLKAPEPNEVPETKIPGHLAVVDMPTNPPAAPEHFYPANAATPASSLVPVRVQDGPNYYDLNLRAGYDHMYHGDNNDAFYVSAKLDIWGDGVREAVGKSGWLIPDFEAEIASQPIAKPDQAPHPGSDDGLLFRADFTWPWLHWSALTNVKTNSVCPFCQPMEFRLGPTVSIGFDHLYDDSDYRLARYAGVRLTYNRDGFIEYTVGGTDGLDGTRQQILAEVPFYESRDNAVHFYLRGLWNHGASNRPDILEGGLFVEMPLSLLVTPAKWNDLVPGCQ